MYGIAFFCSFGLGSFSAGPLGYIADNMGTGWVFIVSSGFGLLTLACASLVLIMATRLKRRQARDE